MSEWRSGDTLAWTQRDGVTPPPKGANRWMLGSLALSLTGAWIGMMSTDALCTDHRLWVETLGTVAFVAGRSGRSSGSSASARGRCWRRWRARCSGSPVGFIDMVHSPTRGAIMSILFAVVAVGVLIAAVPVLRSALWMRHADARARAGRPVGRRRRTRPSSCASGDQPGGRTSHQSTGSRGRSEA